MSTGTHERPGLFARFRKPASVAEAPRAYPQESAFASEEPHGINGPEDIAAFLARTASGPPAEPWGPWDQPAGPVPHSEPETPLEYEYQRFYGWGLTLPDNRAPLARSYVPGPYVPDLYADIIELPVLRDVIRWRAQSLHAGCQCERRAEDSTGWLASQYADLRPGEDSWWAAEPVQDEAETAEMSVAA